MRVIYLITAMESIPPTLSLIANKTIVSNLIKMSPSKNSIKINKFLSH